MSLFSQNFPQITDQKQGLIYNLSLFFLLLFIFFIPWADALLDGLVRIVGIIAFGLSGLLLLTTGTHRNYTYFHFFVLLLWAWIILSVAWTQNLELGLEYAPRLFQIMLLPFLLTLVLTTRKSIGLSYQAYVLGNMIGSSIIIYNYLHGIEGPNYQRYTIKNIETDSMSILLALAIPMAAYLASNVSSKLLRIVYTLAIPLVFFAIFLTGTRTGSIVGGFALLYWFYTQRKASLPVKAMMIVAFILSIFVVANYAPKASVDRVFSAGKSLKSGDLNYRTVIWNATIKRWKEAPLVGVGLGSLGDVLSREHVNYDVAHNSHLHILAENGIIGVSLYIVVELSVLLILLNTNPFPEKVYLSVLFLCILISQLTLHLHWQKETWYVFTIIIIHGSLLQRTELKKINNIS